MLKRWVLITVLCILGVYYRLLTVCVVMPGYNGTHYVVVVVPQTTTKCVVPFIADNATPGDAFHCRGASIIPVLEWLSVWEHIHW